ncbi:ferritin-like domain-containing protein [Streptomyces sp. SL13]|uniref:Ferritin-like domain-containing protein n=1 Tax=Streptantibioticus silvisoli TaxID=2705255 RepID=A0AA90HC09_9ACTN|nr:ferritin-like domain-containing protein [Streptantibioticus silvisoli]MDI5965312.1 ferritin-like domain-containing protein [Streptantibioticus silvisoli]MDI5972905.1 ferritin-like domain-containing protein [Streptantibioticus silvisoli]
MTAPRTEVAAAQAALAAEYAAVYGYGVVGARVGTGDRADATAAYTAHRSARDAMRRAVRTLGVDPVAADAGYALPFPVPDAAAAVRLAAELEDRVADAYADLVAACDGPLRGEAAACLRDAAVRAVRWRGSGPAFPGMPERDGVASDAASPAADSL